MEYFKINYNKLQNLHQLKYFIVITIILVLFILLLILSFLKSIYKVETLVGIYTDNILKIKINITFSDTLKNNKYITFNDKKTKYEIIGFEDYEIIDNEVYQIVDLKVDGDFYQNEVGIVKLYYDREKIITYVLDLFK